MARIELSHDDMKVEMEGRMALGIVIDPAKKEGEEPSDSQASLVGTGNIKMLFIRSMGAMVSLVNSAFEDPVERSLMHMVMLQSFKNAVFGLDGADVEIVRKEVSNDVE